MAVDQSSRYMTKNRLAKQDERLYLGMFKYNHLNTIFWTLNLVSHTKKDRDKQSTVSHKRDNKNIYKYRVLIFKVHFHLKKSLCENFHKAVIVAHNRNSV